MFESIDKENVKKLLPLYPDARFAIVRWEEPQEDGISVAVDFPLDAPQEELDQVVRQLAALFTKLAG